MCSTSVTLCSSSDETSGSDDVSEIQAIFKKPSAEFTQSEYSVCVDQLDESENWSLLTEAPVRRETWGIEDVRRHWVLKDHCDVLYLPCQEPNLALPTKLGRYLWDLHRASGRPYPHILKTITRCALGIVRDLNMYETQLNEIIICDNLLDVSWLDYSNRRKFIDGMETFIKTQKELVMVSFENSRMKRSEGMRLLFALGVACGTTVNRLYMWEMFARDENPVLKDTTFCKYRDKGAFKASSTCKMSFWRAMIRFSALTVISVNYGYLADRQGHSLLMLASVLTGTLKELQILCLEDEIPNHHNCNDFDGLFRIKDKTWRDAVAYCPGLGVYMVFIAIPKYENIMRFLTQSIPLRHIYISSGIDLRFQHPWSMDNTLQILELWYHNTLEVLCLHLWRNREDLDMTLTNLLVNFPRLKTLEFCGILYKDDTITDICEQIRLCSSDSLCISKLKFRVQETYSAKDVECNVFSTDMEEIARKLQDIEETYRDLFTDRDIELDLGTLPF